MVDLARNKLLQQKRRLFVPQMFQHGPQLFGGVNLLDPNRRSLLPRLQHPWPRNMLKVVPDVAVIEHGNKIRHAHVTIQRLHAHGQLVAEIAHGGQPHPWYAQVLANSGGGLHVVLVERNNAVDLLRAREVRHGLHDVADGNLSRKKKRVVQALPRPIGIAQFLRRQQDHAAALALALAHELLSLLIGRDAKKS